MSGVILLVGAVLKVLWHITQRQLLMPLWQSPCPSLHRHANVVVASNPLGQSQGRPKAA